MHTQMLLAGKGFIEPTIPVGGLAFSDTDTKTYPGNGSYSIQSDDTFIIPDEWKEKQWTYSWSVASTADYVCVGYLIEVYKNGVLVYSASQPASNDGYFRYNSGTRNGNHSVNLKAGDYVRGVVRLIGRNVGGNTPVTTSYHELKRTT